MGAMLWRTSTDQPLDPQPESRIINAVSVSSPTTPVAVGTYLLAKVVTVRQQWGPRIRIGNRFR